MDIEFNKNEDQMKQLVSAMEKRLEKIYLGEIDWWRIASH